MKPSRNWKWVAGILASISMIAAFLFVFNFQNLVDKPAAPEIRTKVKRTKTVKNPTYQEFLQKGDRAVYVGDFTSALSAYQKASELEPHEILPYEKIGDVYFFQKNYASALQNYELAQSQNPESAVLKMKIVRTYLGLRKIPEAKAKVDAMAPPTQASLYYQGFIAAFTNDRDTSKDLLTKSLTAGSDETLKTYAQKILTNFRDFELTRDAKVEFLQTMLAQTFDQVGEYGLAIELAFDALKTKHDYRDTWIVLGHAFLQENKWPDSEDALTKSIELDSSHPASFFFRGIARRNLKKNAEALADFEQAVTLGWQPKILVKEQQADIYFDSQDFEKAFPLYKEVVETDPTDIRRFIRPMALAINHLKKPQEASELAKKAYEIHPDTAMAHNLIGWAALASDDLKSARQHLNEAKNRDPELDAVYLNLGQLEEQEGNMNAALQHYEKAIELAEKSGNLSIGNTAAIRYNGLKNKDALSGTTTPEVPKNKPASEFSPSFSLE